MKEFFGYFFGQGEGVEFKEFTLAHFLPIALMIGAYFVPSESPRALPPAAVENTVKNKAVTRLL